MDNTYVKESGAPLNPISQKYNGNGDINQKVKEVEDNKVFSMSSSENASVQTISLPLGYRNDAKTLVVKGNVMPLSEGPNYHEAALFGIGDRVNGVLFINGKICYANKDDINNISYNFNQWYEIELNVNLESNKYNIKINGNKIADDIPYNNSDDKVTLFAGHHTTAYFDNILIYTMKEALSKPIDEEIVFVDDTVYTGNENKQQVKIEGLVEGVDFDVTYSSDCINAGTVTVVINGKGEYYGSLTTTYQIQKASKDAPILPVAQSINKNSIELSTLDGCEYSIDGEIWQESNIFDNLEIATTYTFYQRYKETNNYYASDVAYSNISTHTHEWSLSWKSDETKHWKQCSCGDLTEGSTHIFDNYSTIIEATETSEGLEEGYCSICNYRKTRTIPILSHTHHFGEEWETNETHHWHSCSGCEENELFEEHQFNEWLIINEPTHSSSGLKEHKCIKCDYKETLTIAQLQHTYSSTWSFNSNKHWHECECGEKNDINNHSLSDWVAVKDATTTEKGEENRRCDCGYIEVRAIDKLIVSKNNKLDGGTIAGIIGGVTFIGLGAFSLFWFVIRKKKSIHK